MNITKISIQDLKPYRLNAKLHPPEQIEKIIRSITLTGFDQPIVVNKDMTIIKGHGRLEAAKQMGIKEVPVIILDIPKDIADKARLIDNKSAESDYDIEVLLTELSRFRDELDDVGYSDDEVNKMMEQLEEMTTDIDILNENNNEDNTNLHKCPNCGFEYT